MTRSEILFELAKQYIPGGVNSPVRAFNGVGGTPLFIKRGKGAHIFDEDNNAYIDFVGSWGPMILGHNHPDVVTAIQNALEYGTSFGAPTESEIILAKMICDAIPSIEMVRMVNSGTEATMTALRLARGYTGRDLIIKFEGCYHGHNDSLLIKAGSGALTLGHPSSPGVPADTAKHTLNLQFNDAEELKRAFKEYENKIAAVILEPIPANMNCVLPKRDFLVTLRELCSQQNTVLIFDEVITGFRVGLEGAQGLYQITPDLTTYGKIIGGGLPVGALGGKKAIMAHLAPLGKVYQAGTLSGNPLAMAAGIATLKKLQEPNFYPKLTQMTEILVNGFNELAQKHRLALQINWITGMFGLFFNQNPVNNFADVMKSSVDQFKQFYHGMLAKGIYFGPSAFEAAFVSSAMDKECIAKTLDAADKVFSTMK